MLSLTISRESKKIRSSNQQDSEMRARYASHVTMPTRKLESIELQRVTNEVLSLIELLLDLKDKNLRRAREFDDILGKYQLNLGRFRL